jgi:4'-phosphopantetheinyl transferase
MLKITVVRIDPHFSFEPYLPWFNIATQQKILSYHFRIDQIRSFTSEMLKYYYLADILNLPQQQINIQNTPLGKPIIADLNNVHFNISHSGEYVVMAVANSSVGIDIEQIDWNINPAELGKMVLSVPENATINGDLKKFFLLWTKKEALFKANGTGFINDYYNQTCLTTELIEKTASYIIATTLFAKKYYLSICFNLGHLN